MEFSEELKKNRERAKLSQDELAQQLGVTRRTVSSWETGDNVPQPKMKRKIDALFQDQKASDPVIEVDRSVVLEALIRNVLKQQAFDRADRQGRDWKDVQAEIDAGTVEEMNKIALRLKNLGS